MDCSLWGSSIHGIFQARIWTGVKRIGHYWATKTTKLSNFSNKGLSSQSYGFFSSHVWMWELDYKQSWAPKNWCFWTVVLEKTLESPLDCKEIQSVHPQGDKSWIFIGRTDAEAETPILWPPDAKDWLTGKDCDSGKDWRQEKKGMTEEEMVGRHHRLNGHEFEWTTGVCDGQGHLVCCSPRGHKESDLTEWLNWNEQLSTHTDTKLTQWCRYLSIQNFSSKLYRYA